MRKRALFLLMGVALSGCSLQPKYGRPAAPVPPSWPVGDAYLQSQEATLPSISWRSVFHDPRLQAIIDNALANNRDLRIAAANVRAARAQYRIQRADILPEVDATGQYTHVGGDGARGAGVASSSGRGTGGGGIASSNSSWSLDVGTTAFEIDLFGRIRSLADAALNRYFEQEAAARATRLSLVGEIADAWLTYASDASLLKIAQGTAESAERSVSLTSARLRAGIAPRTDLRQAEQILATAQADLATQRTALAQDINALQLLVGAPVDPALLPQSIEEVGETIGELPAGLDSTILLRRPDVVQAEYELRATNAEIGAARAALFPKISLTAAVGFIAPALSSLFSQGSFNYSVAPSASYPIFRAGAGVANVRYSQAQRDAALATYEKAIQTAFREVADALARRGTITDELRANLRLRHAAQDSYQLSDARYRGGIDSFLNSLDAQRTLYTAQRSVVTTELTRASNLVTLYRTLGGDETLDAERNGPKPLNSGK